MFRILTALTLTAGLAAPALAQTAPTDLTPPPQVAQQPFVPPAPAPVPEVLNPGAAPGAVKGQHRFILTFESTRIAGMDEVRQAFIDDGIFKEVLDTLADTVALPQDIPVTFRDCGFLNAFWNPADKSVTYCYDLIDIYNTAYDQLDEPESAFLKGATREIVVSGTTVFVLLHELGHAFISLYDIPATGREEDAVDQFATLVLTSGDEPGSPIAERPSRLALLGAFFFKNIAQNPTDVTREILADEHALGQQRYFDVMCMVLGSDEPAWRSTLTPGIDMVEQATQKSPEDFTPTKLKAWLEGTDAINILPQARALRCEDEYKRYNASWSWLVDHFMVNPVAGELSPKALVDQPDQG